MRGARHVIGAFAALALLATGCGGDDDESDAATTTSAAADGGGSTTTAGEPADDEECTADRVSDETLTHGQAFGVAGLDPAVISGRGASAGNEQAAIFDTLMRFDIDAGEYVPQVAESLEPNADNTEWTLTLRDGVTFGNGDPLTADIVVTSIERHRAEGSRSRLHAAALGIETMTATDDSTVVFTMSEPWGSFPAILSGAVGMIVNPAMLDATGVLPTVPPPGSGVGPFVVDHWAQGEELVMNRRDDYWGGPVCIATLRFIMVPGARATYESFQNDELTTAALYGDPEVIATTESEEGRLVLNHGGQLMFNFGAKGTTPVTLDPRIREAVIAAIDVDVLNERAEGGAGSPTRELIPESSDIHPDVEATPYDPERAAELVEEAKADGWDGTIRYLTDNNPIKVERALAAQAMLESVGFTVELDDTLNTTDFIAKVNTQGDFDIADWAMSISDVDPWTQISSLYQTNPNGPNGFSDPDMDAALAELRGAGSREEQREALAGVQEAWNATFAGAVHESVQMKYIWQSGVGGLRVSADDLLLFGDAFIE